MKNTILIQEKTFDKARKLILESKEKNPKSIIIFSSNNDELNRKILEHEGEKIDILLLSQSERKDRLKQRDSGFNQILAKIAKEKKVDIGILLDEIIESAKKPKQTAEILARIKQNIKLCNKNKLRMKFIALKKKNERDVYDLKALGLTLGMPTWMTKEL